MSAHTPPECSFLCWGEVLWDLFPAGPKLGGSVANVAFHLGKLGARPTLVSRIGDDELGHRAVEILSSAGVETRLIQVDSHRQTGTVRVDTKAGEPHYTLSSGGAWEHIELTDQAREALPRADLAIFGMLLGRNRHGRDTIREATAHCGDDTRILVDANVRPVELDLPWLRDILLSAHVVKLNEAEYALLSTEIANGDAGQWLLDSGRSDLVALTLGAKGCRLRTRESDVNQPGVSAQPGGDNVGAGDAFVAVLALGSARGWPLDTIAVRANRYASFVASQPGATPQPADELVAATVAPVKI